MAEYDSDANTSLLLHCNGADGSTTFTDSSGTPKAMTANDNAQIDTAKSKFGGASGLFDGTSDYLTTPSHADFDISGSDYTKEAWIYIPSTTSADAPIMARRPAGQPNGWMLFVQYPQRKLHYAGYVNGAWTDPIMEDPTIFPVDKWTHIAITRSGSDARMFTDGTIVKTATITTIQDSSGSAFVIGTNASNGEGSMNGWIDEVRFSKGVARWTANFNPDPSFVPKVIFY